MRKEGALKSRTGFWPKGWAGLLMLSQTIRLSVFGLPSVANFSITFQAQYKEIETLPVPNPAHGTLSSLQPQLASRSQVGRDSFQHSYEFVSVLSQPKYHLILL